MTTTMSSALVGDFRAGPRIAPRVPAEWVEAPYTRFSVTPLSPTIGAVVQGVGLDAVPDDELFDQLNRALLEWKVLFFREQDVTPEQHAAFAGRWGALEAHPFAVNEQDPKVLRLAKNEKAKGTENTWHSDVTWRLEPSLGSVLRAIEVPEVGGDTLWADMGAAYDGLSAALKEQIDGLVAEHDWITTFGMAMNDEQRAALRPKFPAAHHPVVRTHPETGRKTLYVNRAFTQHIVGMDPDESRALLERLWAQAMFPEYQCRWRWQAGDVAFWDNRSTQHYAASDYFPQRRVMERITVVGDKPF